jgi:hypothetical protein
MTTMHYAVKQNTDLAIRNCRRLTSRTHSTGNTITSHATFALVCIAAFFSFKDQDLQGQTVFVSLATKVSLWSHFCNLQLATINVQTVPYFINSRLHLKHMNSTEHSPSWQALLKKKKGENPKLITVFTTALRLSTPWVSPSQLSPYRFRERPL